jgi:hypothetical protein
VPPDAVLHSAPGGLATRTGNDGAHDRIQYSKNTERHSALAGASRTPKRKLGMIVRFPYSASRRIAARRRRRSKNGTPEERAAKAAAVPTAERVRKQRCSKNGSPEERAAKKPLAPIIDLASQRAKSVVQVMTAAEDGNVTDLSA